MSRGCAAVGGTPRRSCGARRVRRQLRAWFGPRLQGRSRRWSVRGRFRGKQRRLKGLREGVPQSSSPLLNRSVAPPPNGGSLTRQLDRNHAPSTEITIRCDQRLQKHRCRTAHRRPRTCTRQPNHARNCLSRGRHPTRPTGCRPAAAHPGHSSFVCALQFRARPRTALQTRRPLRQTVDGRGSPAATSADERRARERARGHLPAPGLRDRVVGPSRVRVRDQR